MAALFTRQASNRSHLTSRCVASTLSQPIGPSEAQIYLLAMYQRSSTGGRAHRSRRHSLGPPSPIATSRRARSFHLDSSSLDVATQLRIQQMEQVQIAISTESRPVGDVRYVMTVRHLSAHAVWRMYRSFDEDHAFRGRLLRALHHGHACSASCPWLESFLMSYFPARSAKLLPRWWDSTKRFVAHRQEALAHVLQTVQTYLCTQQNQACPVLSSSVTSEFLDFVYGQVVDDKRVLARALARDAAAVTSRSRSPCRLSFISVEEGVSNGPEVAAVDDKVLGEDENLCCALCGIRMPERNVYVTQLGCGHRFHDECVLPKLNQALECPTCGAHDNET